MMVEPLFHLGCDGRSRHDVATGTFIEVDLVSASLGKGTLISSIPSL
jgi:hypothetical protein